MASAVYAIRMEKRVFCLLFPFFIYKALAFYLVYRLIALFFRFAAMSLTSDSIVSGEPCRVKMS